jgi:hypothetical protein
MRPLAWLTLAAVLVAAALSYLPASRTKADADRRHRELESRQQEAMRRLADKEAAVRALLRGELTLDAAADRFRAADAGDPVLLARLRQRHAGVSDHELYCRQVIDHLRAPGRPADARVLAARLDRGERPSTIGDRGLVFHGNAGRLTPLAGKGPAKAGPKSKGPRRR